MTIEDGSRHSSIDGIDRFDSAWKLTPTRLNWGYLHCGMGILTAHNTGWTGSPPHSEGTICIAPLQRCPSTTESWIKHRGQILVRLR